MFHPIVINFSLAISFRYPFLFPFLSTAGGTSFGNTYLKCLVSASVTVVMWDHSVVASNVVIILVYSSEKKYVWRINDRRQRSFIVRRHMFFHWDHHRRSLTGPLTWMGRCHHDRSVCVTNQWGSRWLASMPPSSMGSKRITSSRYLVRGNGPNLLGAVPYTNAHHGCFNNKRCI